MSDDIVERLLDLHKLATKERSHFRHANEGILAENLYYVGKCAIDAAAEIDRLRARLAEVHQTLAPLVDDDNRPVEALARHAVARLAEAEADIARADYATRRAVARQDRIAALPEWPSPGPRYLGEYICAERDAALARLALAREWIAVEHRAWCDYLQPRDGVNPPCSCGRDALLKALAAP